MNKDRGRRKAKYVTLQTGSEETFHWSLSVGIREKSRVFSGAFCLASEKARKYRMEYNKKWKRRQGGYQIFRNRIKSDGICLFCGEIEWCILEEHHPYPDEMSDITFTLCANCHRRLHWYMGGNQGVRK